MNPAHPNCQLFSVHNSAFLSHHEGREISAYAEINFLIYTNIFLYMHNKEWLGILLRNSIEE